MRSIVATGYVTLDDERVERLKNAVTLAAAGAFERAIQALVPGAPDGFSEVEEMLLVFFTELKEMTEHVEAMVVALETTKHELTVKLETIEAQQAAIKKLSTPIVDAWEGILALPLIGRLDAGRAGEISDKLLRRIAESRTRWVIIDLTGIDSIDAETAEHLIHLAMAVKLLGSRCVITGMVPMLVQALMALGTDLSGLKPLRALRDGLRYCLTQELGREALRSLPK